MSSRNHCISPTELDASSTSIRHRSAPYPTSKPSESTATGSKPTRKPGTRRHVSCQGCRTRKMRCSRSYPCASCKMRGDTCIWEGASPNAVSEENELDASQSEIARLRKLVDLLMARLEDEGRSVHSHSPPSTSQQLAVPEGYTVVLPGGGSPISDHGVRDDTISSSIPTSTQVAHTYNSPVPSYAEYYGGASSSTSSYQYYDQPSPMAYPYFHPADPYSSSFDQRQTLSRGPHHSDPY